MDNRKFVELMIAKRKEKNISQEQMAEIIDVSVVTMSYIEQGDTEMDIGMCMKAAKALDIPAEEIFSDVEHHNESAAKKHKIIHRLIAVVIALIIVNLCVDVAGEWYKKFCFENFVICTVVSCENNILTVKERNPDAVEKINTVYTIRMDERLMQTCNDLKNEDIIIIHYYFKLLPDRVNRAYKIESIELHNGLKII
ncbi:MAG: helix-turn-helix transcriptional regulator [Thermoflexaceae bacterium]|nr:helix-turn-helix transcriptional regulator [Thermoflexaceae bacterium]